MIINTTLTSNRLILLTGTLVSISGFFLFSCMGGNSSKNMNKLCVANPQAKHTATLIFLHGLGDTGQAWSEAFKQLKLKNIKCVCPTAPVMPVTLNGGFMMPSWFDIISLNPDGQQDVDGINKAVSSLREIIEDEEKKVSSSENVFVGGFSQGGAVAMYTAFTHDKPLAGVVGLSTWLPIHSEFPAGLKEPNRNIPVFQGHGTIDPLVPIKWGEMTRDILQKMTTKSNFKSYPMQHSSCPEEMDDVKNFLNALAKD